LPGSIIRATFKRSPSLLTVRALKLISTILLVAIALTAGLVVAAVVALVALAIFLIGRVLGHTKFRVTGPQFHRRSSPPTTMSTPDAIDVTATEVANEPPRALRAESVENERLRA
jgi:hypothetical protein